MMNLENLKVLCLQKHPELYEQTIKLLNDQWPRSRTARLRSLEQGLKDGLPTSLVLVHKEQSTGKKTVLAHSKISPVPYQSHLCFVESVVVAPELRGKGLGRLIMEETENYVKALGVTTVYLTTFDQQEFYKRLGYDFTDPIVVFGGSLKLAEKTDKFNIMNCHLTESIEDHFEIVDNATSCTRLNTTEEIQSVKQSPPTTCGPPPPPPPPPPLKPIPNNHNLNNNAITAPKLTMRKLLAT